ncbi:MAG: MazG family protein [Clostridia bacterium]|nr:MazG family protein [Clostridia bacterium]
MSKQELLKKTNYKFEDLLEIMQILRAPGGCPWDREQTHQSIRKELIEETYEAIEGIDSLDDKIMCEEFGDMLLQIVFHADIANERGAFNIDDICDGICKKLIYRHPHVFADVDVENSEEVLRNWDELKKKEKGQQNKADVLLSVSKALPSLMRAQKLAKKSGIEYSENQVIESIESITQKLKNCESNEKERLLGELLFECGKYANCNKLDSEKALYDKNDSFCAENIKNI